MRVLVDTNILFSALLYPNSIPAKVLYRVTEAHELILCENNIIEFRTIILQKAPQYLSAADELLESLSFELIYPSNETTTTIRDFKDQPILNAALQNKVDLIITGDKDFLSLAIKKPVCITASEFLSMHL